MTPPSRLLIAEDEPLLAAELARLLAQVWPESRLLATVGNGLDAVQQALVERPDVCFLDIRMPGQSGLEAARALAEDWPEDAGPLPLIVFVTAFDQHALAAFEAAAVDYLLKPVEPLRLARTVRQLQERLSGRALLARSEGPQDDPPRPQVSKPETSTDASGVQAETLARLAELLHALGPAPGLTDGAHGPAGRAAGGPRLQVIAAGTGQVVQLVPIRDVLMIEAADKLLRVLTASAEHLIRMPLRELLPQLDPEVFWQIHRGRVVRVDAVRRAVRDDSGRITLELSGLAERPVVSRVYAGRFKAM